VDIQLLFEGGGGGGAGLIFSHLFLFSFLKLFIYLFILKGEGGVGFIQCFFKKILKGAWVFFLFFLHIWRLKTSKII